jgi:DnaJ homolog subfamily C member 7
LATTAAESVPHRAPLYGILHTERARSYLRLKNYTAALKDCALVLYVKDDDVEAWLIRLQSLHGLSRHEEALSDVSELMQKWGTQDDRIRKAHEKADFEVRKLRRPDFYAMFGVSLLASEREIKKAYRQCALDMHPDRFVGDECTPEFRKMKAKEFQLLGEGLEILTNDFKRQLYDEGFDQEAVKE